jgi:DNA-binding MarR family transcriptional regulator
MTARTGGGDDAARELRRGSAALPLGSVLDFLRLLWALDHRLQTTSRRMGRTIGLTGPQRFVLRIVGRRPGISPGELAEILHVDPSTVTPHVKGLARRGFLARRRDRLDGRRAVLVLTGRGRRIDRLGSGTVEAAVRRLLAGTPAGAIRAAESTLLALGAELDRSAARRPPGDRLRAASRQ